MKRHMLLVIFAILAAGSNVFAGEIDCSEPVQTHEGALSGFRDGDSATCAYLGVPYVAPPVGPLRWRAPRPAQKWSGVREASEFGPWCLQKESFDTMSGKHVQSEDCLYLNIWRPRKEGRFPVMVWLHGGGYTTGSGSLDMYRGERLAERGDVVVVTINYRLNVFGFLAHKSLAGEDPNGGVGNYGSLDQVAALEWVKKNISAFGGDPGNVTIFGESAGGWSVCAMVATPLAKGLFQKAILESGSCQEVTSVEKGYNFASRLAGDFGCAPDDIECMRRVPASRMLKLGFRGLDGDEDGDLTYINHIDGHLLDKSPLEIIRAGRHNNVPMLIGSNRDEARALVTLNPKYDFMTKKKYRRVIKKASPENYEQIMKLYNPDDFPRPIDALAQIATDRPLGCPTYRAAAALSARPEPVYYYRFDYDDARFSRKIGAFHGLEIPFVFRAFDRKPIKLVFKKKDIPHANLLSEKIMAYWTAFARTGDPNNAEGLPKWPAFNSGTDPRKLILNHQITVEPVSELFMERCNFLEPLPRFTPARN